MAINPFQSLDIIEVMENFIDRIRPTESIRPKLDIGYKIEEQSVIIHEIRPRYDNPEIKIEPLIAKTTFIKKHNHWKVFWLRSDLKWHSYKPCPVVKSLADFTQLVENDEYHCFWG